MTRTRRTRRLAPSLESLESRMVLSAALSEGTSDPNVQGVIERIQQVREHPAQGAQFVVGGVQGDADLQATLKLYGINDLNKLQNDIASAPARAPLAWNNGLATAAQHMSDYQNQTGVQSHTGDSGWTTLNDRLNQPSVNYGPSVNAGENIFAYARSPMDAHRAFMIDYGVSDLGHRNNIQQFKNSSDPSYKEVGIGVTKATKLGMGPYIVTEVFGSRANTKPYLVGVVYVDSNHDQFYTPGEGLGGVTIRATLVKDASGQPVTDGASQEIMTLNPGGYQMQLDPGTYNVTAMLGSQTIGEQDGVVIGTDNVKVDFMLSSLPQPSATPVIATQKIAPAPVATPVVTPPAPTITTPAPTVVKPTPVVTKPTPVVAKPTPVVTKPTPVVTKPTPVVTAPTPTVTTQQSSDASSTAASNSDQGNPAKTPFDWSFDTWTFYDFSQSS